MRTLQGELSKLLQEEEKKKVKKHNITEKKVRFKKKKFIPPFSYYYCRYKGNFKSLKEKLKETPGVKSITKWQGLRFKRCLIEVDERRDFIGIFELRVINKIIYPGASKGNGDQISFITLRNTIGSLTGWDDDHSLVFLKNVKKFGTFFNVRYLNHLIRAIEKKHSKELKTFKIPIDWENDFNKEKKGV